MPDISDTINHEITHSAHLAKNSVFLTFDDGPLAGTDDVISVLAKKRVKGTLFMVGSHATGQWRKAQVINAQSSGFAEVANHSHTHANNQYLQYYKDPEKVLDGFEKAAEFLNLRTKDARLPGRNTWRVGSVFETDMESGAAANKLVAKGYKIYGWDLEWLMNNGNPVESPNEMLRKVQKGFSNNRTKMPGKMIILMHDVMFRESTGNRIKLEQFIDLLVENEYEMKFISEYI